MTIAQTFKWIRTFRPLLRNRGKIPLRSRTRVLDDTRNAAHWGWEENILGVYTGWKGDQPCVAFLVNKKIHPSRLTALQFIPESLRYRNESDGVATKIVECGRAFELQDRYKGTLQIGLPVGHEHGYGSGTLGLLVRPAGGAPGSEMILSCAHVLAWSRKAVFALPQPGDFIEQPVSLDQDPAALDVAQLLPGFTDLTRQNISSDFALAHVLPGIPLRPPAIIQTISHRRFPADFPNGFPVTMVGGLSGPHQEGYAASKVRSGCRHVAT